MDREPIVGDSRFFRRSGPHSLAAVADAAEAEAPPRRLLFDGVAPLQTAVGSEVSFLNNRKFADALAELPARADAWSDPASSQDAPGPLNAEAESWEVPVPAGLVD